MTPSMKVGEITEAYARHDDKAEIVRDLYRAYQLGVDFGIEERAALQTEISRLRVSLRMAARNDKTSYRHHEARPFDGRKPMSADGTIWLTPREIARRILEDPNLATAADALGDA